MHCYLNDYLYKRIMPKGLCVLVDCKRMGAHSGRIVANLIVDTLA